MHVRHIHQLAQVRFLPRQRVRSATPVCVRHMAAGQSDPRYAVHRGICAHPTCLQRRTLHTRCPK